MKKAGGMHAVKNGVCDQLKEKNQLASFFLRSGLGIVFLYAAIASFLTPTSWAGFFPAWMAALLPVNILLILFSLFEILLALWLFSAYKAPYAGIVAAVILFLITVFNVQELDIVFRDVALLFAALALVLLHKEEL